MVEGIEFLHKRATRYFNTGRYEDCIIALTNIIDAVESTKAEKATVYNIRGTAKYALHQYEEAIKDYDEAIELDPQNVDTYINRGVAKDALKKYEEALADYDKAIELDPKYAEVYNNRGLAKYALYQYKEAIKDYDKAIELSPEYAEAYSNSGLAKYALHQYKEAIKDYDKAIELSPEYAEAYSNSGLAKYALHQYDEALKDYDEAIELDPQNVDTYINRGVAKDALKKYEEALADYDKAIELDPKYAEVYNNRGLAKYALYQYKEAIKDYDKAIELNPKCAEVYYNRGTMKAKQEKYEEAIADYDEAIGLDPEYAEAYINRGTMKAKQEKYKEAIADYDKAIELNPKYAKAYNNRGDSKFGLCRYEEAIKDYDKAIELDPRDAIYFNKGLAKYLLQQYEDARNIITKLIDKKCQQQKEHYKTKRGYKFRPIDDNTINMLQRHEIYFSDVPSLNDPFECPLLNIHKNFEKEILQDEYTPYILSLVAPEGEVLEDKPNEIINNTLLFSHYADSHRGICIEYEITKELLEQGKILHADVQYSNDTQAKNIEHLFAIKEERWEYEHEERFILFGKRQEYEKGTYMKGVRITKIIFGLNTSEGDKQKVYKSLPANNNIRFFNTKSGDINKYFSLEFEKIQR